MGRVAARKSGAMLIYPASGVASTKLDAVQWVFSGQHALQGIALKLLTEACRMHPTIGTYLVSQTAQTQEVDKAMMQLLDVLLTKALRVQGLLRAVALCATLVRRESRLKG